MAAPKKSGSSKAVSTKAASTKPPPPEPDTVLGWLELAASAMTRKTKPAEAALYAALGAWRMHRSRELAALVDTVSRSVDRRPLGQGTLKHMQARWLDVAADRDPADLPRLTAAIASGWAASLGKRMAALVEFPDDPRTAVAMARFIAVPPYDSGGNLENAIATARSLLVRIADIRVLDELAPFVARPAIAELAESLRGQLHDAGPLGAAETRLIAAIGDHFGAATRSGDDLLAAIYAAPDDDGPRLVYADWLQSQNDPRGEFIALQLARLTTPPSPEADARERELLAAHRNAWLGPLARIACAQFDEWSRGFVEEFAVDPDNRRSLKATLMLPEWRTIKSLTFMHTARPAPTELLSLPTFAQLLVLRGGDTDLATAAANGAPHGLRELQIASRMKPLEETLAGAWSGLPALEKLDLDVYELEPTALDGLASGALGQRLRTLVVRIGQPDLGPWLERFQRTALREVDVSYLITGHVTFVRTVTNAWELHLPRGAHWPDPTELAAGLAAAPRLLAAIIGHGARGMQRAAYHRDLDPLGIPLRWA